ncbi:MAG: hypothetical protein KBD83_02980 [Gammaproteobacteria bacterium]|nr:hypothetical protein [Gammaproteobacteria bacterium]
MKKTLFTLSILTLALTACMTHEKTHPIETYSFAPVTAQPSSSSPQKASVLRMMPANITPQFSNYFFIYRESTTKYLTDPYRQFLTAPNTEITTYLHNHLGPLVNTKLVTSDNLTTANFILQENITELYGDYQNKSAPEAITSIQFILYSNENGSPTQIGAVTLNEKTTIAPNNPESLMKGYQQNLDNIAEKASVFINQYVSNKK